MAGDSSAAVRARRNRITRSGMLLVMGVLVAGAVYAWIIGAFIAGHTGNMERERVSHLSKMTRMARMILDPVVVGVRQGELSVDQGRDRAVALLRPIRFGDGSVTLFLVANDGTVILQSLTPEMEGVNQWFSWDAEDGYLIRDLVLAAHENPAGGLISYDGTSAEGEAGEGPTRAAFVLDVPELSLVVGVGINLDPMRSNDTSFSRHAGILGAVMFVLVALPLAIMLLMLRARNRELERESGIRKRVEEVMIEGEQRYRSLYDKAPVGIIQTTLDGRVLRANPTMVAQLGYDSVKEFFEARLNVRDAFYVHTEDRDLLLQGLELNGEVLGLEILVRRRNGDEFWGAVTSRLVLAQNGEPLYIESFFVDIGDRKRVEEELRVSEERYRLVSLQPDQLVWEFRPLDGWATITGDLETVAGYSDLGDGPDLVPAWFERIHPDDLDAVQEVLDRARESEGPFSMEYRFLHGRGEYVYMEARGLSLLDEGGRAYRFLGTTRDVTLRKQAELGLARSEATLRAMFNASQDATLLVDKGGTVLTANLNASRRAGRSPEELVGLALSDWMDEEVARSRMAIVGDVVESKAPAWFVDERDGVFYESSFYPVLDDQGEVDRVAIFARDITEQRTAELALRESEHRLRSIFENAPVGIFQGDSDGRYLTVNAEFASVLGYDSPGQLMAEVGRFQDSVVDLEAYGKHQALLDEKGGMQDVEVEVFCRGNDRAWLMVNAVAVYDSLGRILRYEGFVHDITEQKADQEALTESEAKYRTLFESAADALFVVEGGAIVDCNPATEILFGMGRQEIIGHTPAELSPKTQPGGRDSTEWATEHVRRARSGAVQRFTWVHRRGDGSDLHTHVSLARFGPKKAGRMLAIIRDMTDRWLAEEQRARFEQIASASSDHMTFTDMELTYLAANQAYAEALGATVEDIIGRAVPEVFGPEAWEEVREHVERARGGEVVTYSQWLDLPGAGRRYFEAVYYPYFDADGIQAGIVANRRDITDRKRIQDALLESERRYRLLAENAADVIWTMDTNLRLTYISPAVSGFTGHSPEEVLRHPAEDFFTRRSWLELEGALRGLQEESARIAEARGGGDAPPGPAAARRLELSFEDKDGRELWADVLVTAILDEESRVEGFQGVTRDMTERKQTREALARSLRFEKVVDLCAKKLLASSSQEDVLKGVLEEIRATAGLNRVFVFVNEEDPEKGLCARLTFEAAAEEFAAEEPMTGRLCVPYAEEMPHFRKTLAAGKSVSGLARNMPQPERGEVEAHGVLSMIIQPLMVAGSWYGFMGFHDMKEERLWDQSERIFLETTAEMVGAYFERVTGEENLRQAYAELDQIFNSTGNGMALYDIEGNVRRVNRPMVDMFRLDPDNIIGRKCYEVLPADCREESSCPAKGGGIPMMTSEGYEFNYQDPDRGPRWIAVSASPFTDARGALSGSVVTYRDITRRVLAQAEADRREEQLVQADKLASLGTLVSGVAHEINNPNGIISLTAPTLAAIWQGVKPLLEERFRNDGDFKVGEFSYSRVRDEVDYLFEQVVESGRRIKRIVAELKDFARQGAADLDQDVDLAEVLQAAVGLVGNKLKKATSRFKFSLPRGPVMVRGNFQRLEQVLVNVLINACEALSDTNQPIEAVVSRDEEAGLAEIRVTDKGLGIAEEDLKHIFDPFFTTKRDQGGTGLGLSVSHGIVVEHGGSMEYQSVKGEGTTLVIRLALVDPDGEADESLEGAAPPEPDTEAEE